MEVSSIEAVDREELEARANAEQFLNQLSIYVITGGYISALKSATKRLEKVSAGEDYRSLYADVDVSKLSELFNTDLDAVTNLQQEISSNESITSTELLRSKVNETRVRVAALVSRHDNEMAKALDEAARAAKTNARLDQILLFSKLFAYTMQQMETPENLVIEPRRSPAGVFHRLENTPTSVLADLVYLRGATWGEYMLNKKIDNFREQAAWSIPAGKVEKFDVWKAETFNFYFEKQGARPLDGSATLYRRGIEVVGKQGQTPWGQIH